MPSFPPPSSSSSGIVFQEADGSPSGTATVVVVTNTKLTSVSGGTATLDLSTGVATSVTFAGVRAHRSSSQSINNATTTAIAFPDADDIDSDAYHDPSTNNTRLTVPTGKAGTYLIGGAAMFAANATGKRLIVIRLNGTTFIAAEEISANASGIDGNGVGVQTIYTLAETDYVELMVHQNSGGALNVIASDQGTQFWMTLVGT